MPRTSIIIAAYNNAKFLPEVLESIFNQTYKDFEVIVVDDASTDNTPEALKPYFGRIIYDRLPVNSGSAAAWNRAMELSRGEYIVLAAGDDTWFPERLQEQIHILDTQPNIGLVYCRVITIDEKGNPLREPSSKRYRSGKIFLDLFMDENFVSPTAIFRKPLVSRTGPLDETLRLCQDYDFALRRARYTESYFLDKVLIKYRKHSGSVTTGKRHNAFVYQRKVIDKIWNMFKDDPESGLTYKLYRKRLIKQCLKEGRYYIRHKEPQMARKSLKEGLKYSPFNINILFQYLRTINMLSRVGRRIKRINLKLIGLFLIIALLVWFALKEINPPYLLPFFIGGLTLVVIGEIIRIWATGHLEKNKSLTTSGPYGYVKNPMYVGSFIIMLGFNAMAINPYIHFILAGEVLLFLFYYVPYKKKIEGARLLERFGEAYADYDRNVSDYIPRKLRAYQGINSEKRWGKTVFTENNELHVAFSVFVGVIAVTLRFWI